MSSKKTLPITALYVLFMTTYLIIAFHIGNNLPITFVFPTPPLNFQTYLHLSIEQTAILFNGGDAGTYASGVLRLLNTRTFDPGAINLWPPGQSIIIAIIVKLFGHANYPLKMLYLSAAIWSLLFLSVYKTLEKLKNPIIKFLLVITPLYLAVFQNWLFDYGLILSENLSIPLIGITTCFIIFWLKSNNIKYLITAALTLAILAYLRGLFEIFGVFLSEIIVLYIAIKLLQPFIIDKIRKSSNYNFKATYKEVFSGKLKAIIIAIVVFHLALLPWRLYQLEVNHQLSWLNQGNLWAGFWAQNNIWSTGDIACSINPKLCKLIDPNSLPKDALPNSVYEKITLMTFLIHPIEWYRIKIANFNIFWFGTANDPNLSYTKNWHMLIKQNPLSCLEGTAIFLAGTGSLIVGLIRSRKKSLQEQYLYIFLSLFFLSNIIIFTFYHYEQRYSFPIQLLFIYLPMWLLFGFKNEPNIEEQTM